MDTFRTIPEIAVFLLLSTYPSRPFCIKYKKTWSWRKLSGPFVTFLSNPSLTRSYEPLGLYLATDASLSPLSTKPRKRLWCSVVCTWERIHSSFSLSFCKEMFNVSDYFTVDPIIVIALRPPVLNSKNLS